MKGSQKKKTVSEKNEKYITVSIELNREKDKDIIDYLSGIKNKREFFRNLLRKEIGEVYDIPDFHRHVMKIKKSVSGDELKAFRAIVISQYDNRAGKLKNKSKRSHTLVFEGEGEVTWEVLDLAFAQMLGIEGLSDYIESWEYTDRYCPYENADLLAFLKEDD